MGSRSVIFLRLSCFETFLDTPKVSLRIPENDKENQANIF